MICHLLAISLMATRRSADLNTTLMGSWVGTLEYRDFSDNSREKLGTLLRVFREKTSGHLVFRYVYDDGPTKVVQDRDEVVIDEPTGKWTILDSAGKMNDTYDFKPPVHWSPSGKAALTLAGHATENGAAVDIRQTLTVDASTMVVLRESKLPGQTFLFRHEYRFTRVSK